MAYMMSCLYGYGLYSYCQSVKPTQLDSARCCRACGLPHRARNSRLGDAFVRRSCGHGRAGGTAARHVKGRRRGRAGVGRAAGTARQGACCHAAVLRVAARGWEQKGELGSAPRSRSRPGGRRPAERRVRHSADRGREGVRQECKVERVEAQAAERTAGI